MGCVAVPQLALNTCTALLTWLKARLILHLAPLVGEPTQAAGASAQVDKKTWAQVDYRMCGLLIPLGCERICLRGQHVCCLQAQYASARSLFIDPHSVCL